jgi:hypothetical protein
VFGVKTKKTALTPFKAEPKPLITSICSSCLLEITIKNKNSFFSTIFVLEFPYNEKDLFSSFDEKNVSFWG